MYRETLDILCCPCCEGIEAPLAASQVFREMHDGELLDAILHCTACGRWFRIEDGIADLVRDELREPERDRKFLSEVGCDLPVSDVKRSDADQRIVDEGDHWGRFMRRFWDVGDRSIFDIRVKGTHPPLYIAGVLEPDDRDADRRWGIFPNRTGDMLFAGPHLLAGKRGVDVGCGGGQFGLEAARQGVRMTSFDPSFEEVRLGREHARSVGARNIDYLRAEPANPPFRRNTFDLFMAKDALHHVPELENVFVRLLGICTADAIAIIHEHVEKAPLKDKLLRRIAGPAVEKSRRRYAKHEIPGELLRDSANEDVSSAVIRPLMEKHFERIDSANDLFFASDVEMYIHFAFGKRRWLSRIAHVAGFVGEKALLLLGQRQHFNFTGRRRTP
ncbi:MAG TPA: methyltransferase domain-containing protein [Candidatus Sumerlaeota bacterium]|nr:methyltransferase domain-containing protein [Candidatus Sumerlaeota bacterium]